MYSDRWFSVLPYHLVSSREHSRALLLDDVHRGVWINKGRASAGPNDSVSELPRRVSGRAAGGESREVAASARQSRLGSGRSRAEWKFPLLRHKNKTLRCHGFKGKPNGYCQGKAFPCWPGGSCGHFQGELRGVTQVGWQRGEHGGKRAGLGELSVTHKGLI